MWCQSSWSLSWPAFKSCPSTNRSSWWACFFCKWVSWKMKRDSNNRQVSSLKQQKWSTICLEPTPHRALPLHVQPHILWVCFSPPPGMLGELTNISIKVWVNGDFHPFIEVHPAKMKWNQGLILDLSLQITWHALHLCPCFGHNVKPHEWCVALIGIRADKPSCMHGSELAGD